MDIEIFYNIWIHSAVNKVRILYEDWSTLWSNISVKSVTSAK